MITADELDAALAAAEELEEEIALVTREFGTMISAVRRALDSAVTGEDEGIQGAEGMYLIHESHVNRLRALMKVLDDEGQYDK